MWPPYSHQCADDLHTRHHIQIPSIHGQCILSIRVDSSNDNSYQPAVSYAEISPPRPHQPLEYSPIHTPYEHVARLPEINQHILRSSQIQVQLWWCDDNRKASLMSSSSDDDDASPDHTEVASNRLLDNVQREASNGGDSDDESFSRTRSPDLLESGTVIPTPDINGTSFQGYGRVKTQDEEEESVDSSELAPLNEDAGHGQVVSPGEGSEQTLETPDDTPSLKVWKGIFCERNILMVYRNPYYPRLEAAEPPRELPWHTDIVQELYNPSNDDSQPG